MTGAGVELLRHIVIIIIIIIIVIMAGRRWYWHEQCRGTVDWGSSLSHVTQASFSRASRWSDCEQSSDVHCDGVSNTRQSQALSASSRRLYTRWHTYATQHLCTGGATLIIIYIIMIIINRVLNTSCRQMLPSLSSFIWFCLIPSISAVCRLPSSKNGHDVITPLHRGWFDFDEIWHVDAERDANDEN